MSTIYPAQIDNSISLPSAIDNFTPIKGAIFNNLRDAVLAIESAVGTSPAGAYTSIANRFSVLEATVGNLNIVQLNNDLGGTLTSPKVIGLQGNPVSNQAPSINQVLTWDGIAWAPANSNLTTNVNVVQLTGQSINGAATILLTSNGTEFSLPNATTASVHVVFLASEITPSQSCARVVSELLIHTTGGSLSIDNNSTIISTNTPSWGLAISASGLILRFTGTGASSKTVNFVALISYITLPGVE